MKRLLAYLLSALLFCGCHLTDDPTPGPGPEPLGGEVESGITYQLLVYSFCDSDSDGVGDFNGIASKLDYLKEMGVSALWLSPVHPSSSYHGYDVLDYDSVNPKFGTEADLKNLVDKAHGMGISVYLDFVLNHTSRDHRFFLDARSSPDSPYRNWYIFSKDPAADIKAGRIPMIETTGYNSGEWTSCASGAVGKQKIRFTVTTDNSGKPKTVTAEKVDDISNPLRQDSGIYLYYGDGHMAEFCSDHTLSLEFESDWGFLIRTSTSDSWPTGTKYGAKAGSETLQWGKALGIYPSSSSFDPGDILLPGMGVEYYHSAFGAWMPDINYGPASECGNSAPFQAMCASADKWINLGIDGFRLDAIKHIYHDAKSDENPTFLKKFYDHCNATWKARGGEGEFYMVGEHFSEANEVAPYYKGLPAYFEFSFWWRLKDAINSGTGQYFVSDLQSYQKMYAQYRSDWIEATKLTNHDEDRAANELQRNISKMKLAAAVLLTASGQPYVYQGEELGYWGTKSGGDEYVRAPVKWTRDGAVASGLLSGKVDNSMLTSDISAEAQASDENSILNVYRKFGKARASYPALAHGNLGYCAEAAGSPSISAWLRTADGQTVLVVHNFSGGGVNINFSTLKTDRLIASNGSVTVNGSKLTVGAYSSALFLQ